MIIFYFALRLAGYFSIAAILQENYPTPRFFMDAPSSVRKILILAANPKNTDRLRLEEEEREIDEGLRRSRHRDRFKLTSKWAVRSRDFYRYMLDFQPQIVHFSGHGAGESGIVLEDEIGQAQLMPTEQLAGLFKLFASKGLECVLLNACYSEVQAEAIHQHISYVIGMNQAIGDKAAIAFAVAFYDVLGAGETVEFAYELGCNELIRLREQETPIFKHNPTLQATRLANNPTAAANSATEPEKSSGKLADKIGVVVQNGSVSIETMNF